MEELNECLKAKREIDKINERLEELRLISYAPKIQRLTGMPTGGGGTESNTERYIVRAERWEQQKEQLKEYQAEQWQAVMSKAEKAVVAKKETTLLYMRFVKGYSWAKCTERMNEKYGKWNINKTFSTYRKVRRKIESVSIEQNKQL